MKTISLNIYSFNELIEGAKRKFDNHIQNVLKRISDEYDYRFTDESIIEEIASNEDAFLIDGTIHI